MTTEKSLFRGVVEKKESSSGKSARGAWTKWGLKIDDQWFSTFDGALVLDVKEGQECEFTFEESGGYKNLASIKVIALAKQEEHLGAVAKLPDIWTDREAAIAAAHEENMRASAYENATRIAVAKASLTKDPAALSMDNIKKVANDFYLEIKAKP